MDLVIKELLAFHNIEQCALLGSRNFTPFFLYAMDVTRILNLTVQKVIFVGVNFKIWLWKSEHFPQRKMDST